MEIAGPFGPGIIFFFTDKIARFPVGAVKQLLHKLIILFDKTFKYIVKNIMNQHLLCIGIPAVK